MSSFTRITLTLLILVLGSAWTPHPFYLSVTNLKYNGDEKRFQGTIKVFTNDFEEAIYKTSGKKTDLLHPADTAAVTALASRYLQPRVQLFADGRKITWKLLGFENEEEATWFFVESARCEAPVKVEITNAILCDFFPQQINIVQLEVAGQQRSSRANCPDKTFTFGF